MSKNRKPWKVVGLCMLWGLTPIYSYAQEEIDPYLSKYREEALAHEQSVQMAENQVSAAEANYRATISDMLPQISLDGNYTYVQNPTQLTLPDILGGELGGMTIQGAANHQYGTYARLNQSIYNGGLLQERKKKADIQKDKAQDQLQLTKTEVVLLTDIQYWQTVAQQEVLAAMEEYRDAMRHLTSVVEDMVESGANSRNDLLMSEVRMNKAELAVVQAENNLAVTKMSFNRLLGHEFKEEITISDSISFLSPSLLMHLEPQVRAELKIAEKEVQESESDFKMVKGKYLPQLNATAVGMYSSPGYDFQPGAVPNMQAGLTMAIPLYAGSKKKNEKAMVKMKVENSQLQLERTQEMLNLEHEQSFVAWQNSLQEAQLAQKAVEKAKENAAIMMDRYEEGMIAILEVLDAQIYFEQAMVDYIQSKLNMKVQYTHYLRAVGVLYHN
ncbi:TolC family protein [Sediminitomix flava]|uniref:Outer membrane protein TolC n=1 Tax=Sediminitomix flava TaxID=379075 RepID=A0A315ZGF8_SEDFL|nr:TolC family protein [Sediminitomix flava]PWJ44229.1 outer membrane protein TolC [Sediminitomix flava]